MFTHSITDNEILGCFIHGLEPITGCEVFKENPQAFEQDCILAKRILWLEILFGRDGFWSKWRDSLDYAPIELDSIGTG